MLTRRTIIGLLASASALVLGACEEIPRWGYRYRLTLDVDVDGRIHSGSSVVQYEALRDSAFVSHQLHWGFRGEAAGVDLGDRGVLFAILANRGPAGELRPDPGFGRPEAAAKRLGLIPADADAAESGRAMGKVRGKLDLLPSELPFLVRFRDLNDPKTVEAVDPENLAASFGPGVKLVGAKVEITDDPVTTGIDRQLPWLSNLSGRIGKNLGLPYLDLRNQLSDGSFKLGFSK